MLLGEVQRSLNELASARSSAPLCFEGDGPSINSSTTLDSARSATEAELRWRLDFFGRPGEKVPAGADCLTDLLKSPDTLELKQAAAVRDYDAQLINVVKGAPLGG